MNFQVLTAVGQGETLMKALQDAVPEDVRGKLTNSLAGILHAQGADFKFDRVLSISQAPEGLAGQKKQEKFRVSGAESVYEDQSSLNQMEKTSGSLDGSDNAPSGRGEPAEGTEREVPPLDKSPNSTNLAQSQESNNEVGSSDSFGKETGESGDNNDTNEELKEKAVPDIDHSEKGLETGSKPYTASHPDGVDGSEEAAAAEQKNQNTEIAQSDTKEENDIQIVEQKSQDLSSDQSKMTSTGGEEAEEPSSSPMSSEHQTIEREGNDNEKKESKNIQNISQQTNSTSSDSSAATFSVSQAFNALTGMDDSTQVAVNSVFGVIENMISQIEQSSVNEGEGEVKDGKDVESKLEEKQKSDSQSMGSNASGDLSGDDHRDGMHLKNDCCHTEEQLTQSLSTINGSRVFSPQNHNSKDHLVQKESNTNSKLIDKRYLVDRWGGHRHENRMPRYLAIGSYRDFLYNEHIRKYLVSKIPTKSLDLDSTTALLLEYFPEEGQWKLFEQPQNMAIASGNIATSDEARCKLKAHSSTKSSDVEQYIEPPYVILDTEKQQEHVKEFITTDTKNKIINTSDDRSKELIQFVKMRVLDALKMEVGRKLNAAEIKIMKSKLAGDMEHVANAISLAVVHSKVQELDTESQVLNVEGAIEKVALDGEHIISVISSSVQETGYLRRVMPVGVIVGSILAALRKYFNVATLQDNGPRGSLTHDVEGRPSKKNYGNVSVREMDQVLEEKTSLDHLIKREAAERGSLTPDDGGNTGKKNYGHVGVIEIDQVPEEKTSLNHSIKREAGESESEHANKNNFMVGAVTAALGASALLMQKVFVQSLHVLMG